MNDTVLYISEPKIFIDTVDKEEGEVRLLALRNTPKEYIITDDVQEQNVTNAVEWLKAAGGGTIYKLEYVKDKYGDIIPKCEKLGIIE
jgi:hypothetical protein